MIGISNLMNMYCRNAKKAGKKLTALIRISKFMTFAQRRNIMKAFIESQFAYCPLVWVFCGRQTNARINHIH